MRATFPFLALLALLAATGAFAQGWQDRYNLPDDIGNLTLPVQWNPETGIRLDLRPSGGGEHLSVFLHPEHTGIWRTADFAPLPKQKAGWLSNLLKSGPPLPEGERLTNVHAFPGRLPAASLPRTECVLKLRAGYWEIYLHDRPILLLPRQDLGAAIVAQPLSDLPARDPQAVRFQKVRPYQFSADFMIPEEQANKLGTWEPQAGEWRVHSALDDALEQQASDRLRQRPLEAERSANFYSLTGSGEKAIITNGYPFLDNYSLASSILLSPGTSGLVFYYQDDRNYYEMTMQVDDIHDHTVTVELSRLSSSRLPRRLVLAAAEVDLTADQWIYPRVEVGNDRIRCYIDDVEILDVTEDLPVGGRFGLTVVDSAGIRFDDVDVQSMVRLRLDNLGWIQFHAQHDEGGFLGGGASWLGLPAPDRSQAARVLQPPHTPNGKWLAIGSPLLGSHVFSASFSQHARESEFGILTGYRGSQQPHYRFVRKTTAMTEEFSLLRITDGSSEVVERRLLRFDRAPAMQSSTRLLADATEKGELRLYRDGKLVLIHHPGQPVEGGAGLYVGPETTVRISELDYRRQRQHIYKNKREKNQIYVSDPYMRHWSSPEGEWITDSNGIMWHKSDFLGRFALHMPYVATSVIHLGVPEDSTNGQVRLAISDRNLTVQRRLATAGTPTQPEVAAASGATSEGAQPMTDSNGWETLTSATLPAAIDQITEKAAYAVYYEDGCLWGADADQNLIFKTYLDQPLSGHRIRLEGFTYENLMASYVEMYNLKDFLFNEAPHAWTINGGKWQVINRFQCDPRWSHFNGENGDGLAALWSKYRFSGDFCVELYAGVRHDARWYNRTGDLNITVMNQDTTPGQGYTVTTTSWDQNESQLWTLLYRNGEEIARSDKYLMPRQREGNVRLAQNPLLGTGRPVHGAWYYLKLRRVGNKLEFYFDNERVFVVEEDEPIPSGSMGIWTFMNSMMVARVRFAAEHIEPKPLTFRRVSPGRPQQDETPEPFPLATSEALLDGDQPLIQTQPAYWTSDDQVGHGQLDWQLHRQNEPAFVFTNILGGGAMPVRYTGKPVPLDQIAGWQFDVKRTPDARFNLYYSIGRLATPEGEPEASTQYVPSYRFYHQLSGPAVEVGPVRSYGATEIPAQPGDGGPNWHEQGDWHPVTAWLPGPDIAGILAADGWFVRLEGFGIYQESQDLKGLNGNFPGAAYAVKQFTPIYYRPPDLHLSQDSDHFRSFMLLKADGKEVLTRSADLAGIRQWIERQAYPALHRLRLRTIGSYQVDLEQELAWVTLPEKPKMEVVWDDETPNAVRLSSRVDFRDPRFATATVRLADQAVHLRERSMGVRVGYVPRSHHLFSLSELPVSIVADGFTFSKKLPWQPPAQGNVRHGERQSDPPILVGVEGLAPIFLNFEDLQLGETITGTSQRRLVYQDEQQDTFLRTQNQARNQRLGTSILTPFNLSRYPLLQFRYRASEQARVSLNYGTIFFAELNEPNYYASRGGNNYAPHAVRCATPLMTDGTWRSWTGILSDVPANEYFRRTLFAADGLHFSSFHGIDQTGRYSSLDLDDVTLGPAVRNGKALTFTPVYLDADGVASVQIALRSGATPYQDLYPEARNLLSWTEVANQEPCTPSMNNLTEGVCHLYIKAIDSKGNESQVTDIPFLYDRSPPVTSHRITTWDEPLSNGTALHLFFDSESKAPLDLEALRFLVDDAAVTIDTQLARIIHSPDRDTILVDYPHAFMNRLNTMNDGDSFSLRITNIQDGAGNQAEDMVVPIQVDHQRDKRGPAWLPLSPPDNVLRTLLWEGRRNPNIYVTPARNNNTTVIHANNTEPFLRTSSYGRHGMITLDLKNWDPETYTHLSLRLRRHTIPKDSETTVNLVLTYDEKKRLIIPLDTAHNGGASLPLDQPIKWEADTWYPITVNVYERMVRKLGRERASKITFESIGLQRTNTENGEPMDLQNLVIYHPWQGDNTLKLQAYDASGVSGLTWAYAKDDGEPIAHGQIDSLSFVPAELPVKRVDDGWLLLQARDKAGNLSVPMRLPMPPPDLVSPKVENQLLDN